MDKKTFTIDIKKENWTDIMETFRQEEGYLVEYEDGYKSWSPKSVFEKAYRVIDDTTKRFIIGYSENETCGNCG